MSGNKYSKVKATIQENGKVKTVEEGFVSSGCKHFFNAQHLLIQLNEKERAFYDYLCESMNDKSNNITVDAGLKEEFKQHIERITKISNQFTKSKLTKYVSQLKELGLLILLGSAKSAFYCINPKYAYKGSEKNRVSRIKSLIEELNKRSEDVSMLITHDADKK